MTNDLFNFSFDGSQLNLALILANLVLAFVLSLIVAMVYRNTHKGLSYSQSFTFSLVMIGLLITVIITAIGTSVAAALGVFGAFSIIRFRTAIKDPKDVSFILLVMAIGLAVGTGNYILAVIATIFLIAVIYYLSRINFGSIRKYDYVLNCSARADVFSNEKMREIFKEFLRHDNLLNVVSRDNGQLLEYSFNIKFIRSEDMEKFASRLNALEGMNDVDIVSAKNDIEY